MEPNHDTSIHEVHCSTPVHNGIPKNPQIFTPENFSISPVTNTTVNMNFRKCIRNLRFSECQLSDEAQSAPKEGPELNSNENEPDTPKTTPGSRKRDESIIMVFEKSVLYGNDKYDETYLQNQTALDNLETPDGTPISKRTRSKHQSEMECLFDFENFHAHLEH